MILKVHVVVCILKWLYEWNFVLNLMLSFSRLLLTGLIVNDNLYQNSFTTVVIGQRWEFLSYIKNSEIVESTILMNIYLLTLLFLFAWVLQNRDYIYIVPSQTMHSNVDHVGKNLSFPFQLGDLTWKFFSLCQRFQLKPLKIISNTKFQ